MGPLTWLKNRVRDACLAGVEEALATIQGDSNGAHAAAARRLEARLTVALPAPGPEERRRKRADP